MAKPDLVSAKLALRKHPCLLLAAAPRFVPRPVAGAAARAPAAGISDRQRRLLAILAEREWITNAEYCALVGVSTRTGLRDLQELITRRVITMEGKRRGARYRLADG